MSAFAYCSKRDCDGAFRASTAREDLIDVVVCEVCGTTQPQRLSIEEWVADLDERLRLLEVSQRGCVCPPTSEQTCDARDCPRKGAHP